MVEALVKGFLDGPEGGEMTGLLLRGERLPVGGELVGLGYAVGETEDALTYLLDIYADIPMRGEEKGGVRLGMGNGDH